MHTSVPHFNSQVHFNSQAHFNSQVHFSTERLLNTEKLPSLTLGRVVGWTADFMAGGKVRMYIDGEEMDIPTGLP